MSDCPIAHEGTPREIRFNLTISGLQVASYENARQHGFHDDKQQSIFTMLGNLHCEVSEAWEEARKPGFIPAKTYYNAEKPTKPEGLPAELADIMIRCADTAETFGIDLEAAIKEKMAYNRTRPHRHGGKVI